MCGHIHTYITHAHVYTYRGQSSTLPKRKTRPPRRKTWRTEKSTQTTRKLPTSPCESRAAPQRMRKGGQTQAQYWILPPSQKEATIGGDSGTAIGTAPPRVPAPVPTTIVVPAIAGRGPRRNQNRLKETVSSMKTGRGSLRTSRKGDRDRRVGTIVPLHEAATTPARDIMEGGEIEGTSRRATREKETEEEGVGTSTRREGEEGGRVGTTPTIMARGRGMTTEAGIIRGTGTSTPQGG